MQGLMQNIDLPVFNRNALTGYGILQQPLCFLSYIISIFKQADQPCISTFSPVCASKNTQFSRSTASAISVPTS